VSILESLKHNQFLKSSVRLFEIGKTFQKNSKGKLPVETTELVIGVIGGETWPINEPEAKEYYDIKGVLENVFGTEILLDFVPTNLTYLAAGRQAKILVGKEEIGYIGELSSATSKKFGIERLAAIAVINVEKVLAQIPDLNTFKEFSKYQHTNRDLSVLISETVEVKSIQNAVLNSSDIIKNVEVVDIYRDKQLGAGTKSVSIRMFIQSDTKTLTESEIDAAFDAAIKAVTKIGGNIRGVEE
jgi:phenylalanyl-tRNA synthetase beta chain